MEEKDIFKTETIYDGMVHEAYTLGFTLSRPGLIWSHLLWEAMLLFDLTQFSDHGTIFWFLFWSALYLVINVFLLRIGLKKNYRKILDATTDSSPITGSTCALRGF